MNNILKHSTILRVTFLVLLIFLFSSSILAVKPATSGGSLTIVPLHNDYLVHNTTIKFHWHIYNSTFSLIKTSTSCYIHIYNNSDRHIVQDVVPVSGDDFEYVPGVNITSNMGVFPYTMWCNSTVFGNGFLADSFEVTHDGLAKDTDLFIAAILVLMPFLLGFLLMYWVTTLSDQHNVLKLGLSLIAVSTFFISLWYAALVVIRFTYWNEMLEALGFTGQLFAGLLFFIISYFIIYIIAMIFTKIGKDKEEKFNY